MMHVAEMSERVNCVQQFERRTLNVQDKSQAALVALRQILRATEFNSRALASEVGLTPSQLIVLRMVSKLQEAIPSVIAREASLTQATVTLLVDKLESRGLVKRRRDMNDRRRVFVDLTSSGESAVAGAPDLLQYRFESRFKELPDWEQSYLIAALERVASILDAEEIDAAPVLDVGEIDEPLESN